MSLSRKTMKIEVKVKCSIAVEFWAFKTKKMNKKAENVIKKFIKSAVKSQVVHVPFYIEKDASGALLEDASSLAKIKFR